MEGQRRLPQFTPAFCNFCSSEKAAGSYPRRSQGLFPQGIVGWQQYSSETSNGLRALFQTGQGSWATGASRLTCSSWPVSAKNFTQDPGCKVFWPLCSRAEVDFLDSKLLQKVVPGMS
ncbi:uncharacterized protein LOC144169751 isoform X1 [Haemaphysalis longicornis]